MKKTVIFALCCVAQSTLFAQFTGSFPGGSSQQYCNANVTIGNHLVYNSTHGVINWGGNGSGDLYFRRLNTFGTYTSGFNNLMIIKADGKVGMNGVMSPLTSLHLKGDIMMGNNVNGGRWHLHTQDAINGDFFIIPDNSFGADDWGKSVRLERTTGNFYVGDKASAYKVVTGSANGSTMGYGTGYIGFNAARNISSTNWTTKTDGANNGAAMMWADVDGKLRFSSFQSSGNTDATYSDATVTDHRSLTIGWVNSFNSGAGGPQITIGKGLSSGPHVTDYTLAVPGKLVAKEIYVTLTGWADYVFDDSYQLMSLDSLQDYINTNNHLPNVPTTEEVLTNGNNAGETDRILLEKVEELTLYILQLENRIKELEKK
jgi:hypothetical protein